MHYHGIVVCRVNCNVVASRDSLQSLSSIIEANVSASLFDPMVVQSKLKMSGQMHTVDMHSMEIDGCSLRGLLNENN
jgi:hypothetical protein